MTFLDKMQRLVAEEKRRRHESKEVYKDCDFYIAALSEQVYPEYSEVWVYNVQDNRLVFFLWDEVTILVE